jgi:hypothetical protein
LSSKKWSNKTWIGSIFQSTRQALECTTSRGRWNVYPWQDARMPNRVMLVELVTAWFGFFFLDYSFDNVGAHTKGRMQNGTARSYKVTVVSKICPSRTVCISSSSKLRLDTIMLERTAIRTCAVFFLYKW